MQVKKRQNDQRIRPYASRSSFCNDGKCSRNRTAIIIIHDSRTDEKTVRGMLKKKSPGKDLTETRQVDLSVLNIIHTKWHFRAE